MSRRPPSRRNADYHAQLLARQVTSVSPLMAGGRLASASPLAAGASSEFDAGVGTDGGSDGGTALQFAYDTFTLASPTPTLTLTYLPVDESPHAYLNGVEQHESVDYTITDKSLAVLTAMGALSGDIVDVRYAFVTDLPDVPDEPTPTPGSLAFGSPGWKYTTVLESSSSYATDGVEGSTAWTDPLFDDSAWGTGQGAFGWGYGGVSGSTGRGTTLPALSEMFLRYHLPGGGENWTVSVKVDNWGYLYFNGNKIAGTTASGALQSDDSTSTSALHGPFPIDPSWIRSDVNVLALHVQDQAGGGGYGAGDVSVADGAATWEIP